MSIFTDTLSTVVQSTAGTSNLDSKPERQLFLRQVKNDLAAIIGQLNGVHYLLADGLYSDGDNPLSVGLCGNVLYSHVNATVADSSVFWNNISARPKTIKETVDTLLSEIARVENLANQMAQAVAYDDTAITASATANQLNISQLKLDLLGSTYTLTGTGLGTLTYTLAQAVDAIGSLLTGWPALGITHSGSFPALSLPVSSGTGMTVPVFTYLAGGTADLDNRIYDNWADCFTAASTLAATQQVEIAIDDSNGAPTITAGTYDLTNIKLVGRLKLDGAASGYPTFLSDFGFYRVELTLATGVTLNNVHWIENLYIVRTTGTTAQIVYDDGVGHLVKVIDSQLGSDGASELISIDNSTAVVIQAERSFFFGTGTYNYETINLVDAGSNLLGLIYNTEFAMDSIRGIAGSDILFTLYEAGSFYDPTQTNMAGTVTISRAALASNVVYDNDTSALTATDVQAAVDEIAARYIAEGSSGMIAFPIFSGVAASGTWAADFTDGVPALRRTAATATQTYYIDVPLHVRPEWRMTFTTAHIRYAVRTADLDDVKFTFSLLEVPDDNVNTWASFTGTSPKGDIDGDYDAAHNTAAERGDDTGAPEYHTAQVTLSWADVLGADAGIGNHGAILRCAVEVDGDAGGAGVFDLFSIVVKYTERYTGL
jgi:hypothetical protein